MKHLNESINDFEKVTRSQAKKGFKKYGKALDPMDNYSWINMAKEEAVDLYQYLHAQEQVNQVIAERIRVRTKDEEILFWCDVLEGRNVEKKS